MVASIKVKKRNSLAWILYSSSAAAMKYEPCPKTTKTSLNFFHTLGLLVMKTNNILKSNILPFTEIDSTLKQTKTNDLTSLLKTNH